MRTYRIVKKLGQCEDIHDFKGEVIKLLQSRIYRSLPYKAFCYKKYRGFFQLSDYKATRVEKRFLYKYVSEDVAYKLLVLGGGIRFCEPTQWDDQYESLYYTKGLVRSCPNLPEKLFVSCFTLRSENEAAWKSYITPKGDDFRTTLCFRLKVNRSKMISELTKQYKGCNVYESPVAYLTKYQISNMHRPGALGVVNLHNSFFANGRKLDEVDYISLLSMKRNCFFYEDEVRYFIVPSRKESGCAEVYLKNPLQYVEKITVVRPYGKITEEECEGVGFRLSQNELNKLAKRLGVDQSLLESYNPYAL